MSLIDHPTHYNSHPSGIETIQLTEHMNFCLGNAIKYILRCDYKDNPIQDIQKAIWYLNREISRRQRIQDVSLPSQVSTSDRR